MSDLHLTDSLERSTFDVRLFERTLRGILQTAADKAVQSCCLILLGDAFEILKSPVWIERKLRPWESRTPQHAGAASVVFEKVIAANADFFAVLDDARRDFPFFSIDWIPGNHDAPLNWPDGMGCQARLRQLLGRASDDRPFSERWVDERHATLAEHGHQNDASNRYQGSNKAIGDAVVIDILVQLPRLVAHRLGLSSNAPELSFLHAIDNVIPQTPQSMARWLLNGLRTAPLAWKDALEKGLEEVAEEFRTRVRGASFERVPLGDWWFDVLTGAALPVVRQLRTVDLIPSFPENKSAETYLEYATTRAALVSIPLRSVLFGHTHVPEIVPFAHQKGVARYMNTGTWRRMARSPASNPLAANAPAFDQDFYFTWAVVRDETEIGPGMPRQELQMVRAGVS